MVQQFDEEQMKRPQTSIQFPDENVEKRYLCVHVVFAQLGVYVFGLVLQIRAR